MTRSMPSASCDGRARGSRRAEVAHDLRLDEHVAGPALTGPVAAQHATAADVEDVRRPPAADQRAGFSHRMLVQASRSSADIVLMTRSSGTSRSAARSQPCGCHSSWPVAWASVSIENQQP